MNGCYGAPGKCQNVFVTTPGKCCSVTWIPVSYMHVGRSRNNDYVMCRLGCQWWMTSTMFVSYLEKSRTHFTNFFQPRFKFDGNFVSFSARFKHSDRYKSLCMARQLSCRGMCKNCCDLMACNGNTTRLSFHRIWIASKKSLLDWLGFARSNKGVPISHKTYQRKSLQSLQVARSVFFQ